MSVFSEEKSKEFSEAARKGNLPQLQALLKDPEVNVNRRGGLGHTAFYYAVHFGHEKIVEALIADERVEVDIPSDEEKSPLWVAASTGKLPIVRMILLSGRTLELRRKDLEFKCTPGEIASVNDCYAVAELLQLFERDPDAMRTKMRREADAGWLERILGLSLLSPSTALPSGCRDSKQIQHLCLRFKDKKTQTLLSKLGLEFTNLKELILSNNPLDDSHADDISALLMSNQALTQVNLSSTNIGPKGMLKILQALVWNFSQGNFSLERFDVDDMKIESFEGLGMIPVDILAQGSRKTVRYLLDLFRAPEGDPLFRSKLMVVGFAEIGKTSMLECLFPMAGILFTREVKKKVIGMKTKWRESFVRLLGNTMTQSEVAASQDGEGAGGGGGGGGEGGEGQKKLKKKRIREYFGTVILNNKKTPEGDGSENEWSILRVDDYEKPGFRIQRSTGDGFMRELFCDDKKDRERWFVRISGILKRDRTHGIDINEIEVSHHPVVKNHFASRNLKGKLELSVWDFAGQHEYYNNHQHFLSTRSIFLVLWNLSEFDEDKWVQSMSVPESDQLNRSKRHRSWQQSDTMTQGKGIEGLKFWLSSLSLHLNQANEGEYFKVVVVGTHFDLLTETEQNRMGFRKDLVGKLCGSYGLEMSNYLEISCADRPMNIEELQVMVFLETVGMKYMGERLPTTYLAIELFLRSLASSHVTYPVVDIRVVMDKFPGVEERLVRDALGLLSKWGKCVYFEKDPKLRDKVILDPHFLSKTTLAGLFRLGDEASSKRMNGIIYHGDLPVFWSDLAERNDFWEIAELLVSLMEKFDVCFLVPEDVGKPFREQRSLIPSLLPMRPPILRQRKVSAATVDLAPEPLKSASLESLSKATRSRSTPSPLSGTSQLFSANLTARRKFEEEKQKRLESHWPSRLPLNQPIEMERVFKFSVVPEELVSLLLSRCHHMIQDGCVWRDFALLHLSDSSLPSSVADSQATLQVNLDENYFLVEIRAGHYEGGIQLLENIRTMFGEVHEKNGFASWKECVRSPYVGSSLIQIDILGSEEEADGGGGGGGGKTNCPVTGTPITNSLLKRRAGLIPPPPVSDRAGVLIVERGQAVPGVDEALLDELRKYLTFFGGRIEDVAEGYRLDDDLGLEEAFRVNRETLFRQQESAPDKFKKTTHLDQDPGEERDLKIEYLKLFNCRREEFPELERARLTDVIPVVNGHSENAAWNIGMTGFNYSPTLDAGYFGSGIYFTTSLQYALGYGDHIVVSLANAGNVYPVIEHPFELEGKASKDNRPIPNPEGFLGKPAVAGYQSHYSVVKGGYPVKNVKADSMDELVLFQSAQALPLFILKFSPGAENSEPSYKSPLNKPRKISANVSAPPRTLTPPTHLEEVVEQLRLQLQAKDAQLQLQAQELNELRIENEHLRHQLDSLRQGN